MAATAATTIFAYASLLCRDPTDCRDSERNLYAGAVAVATCAANVGGLLFLGTLERLSRENYKAALILWFVLRSMSVVVLVVGYQLRSIFIALSGQLFEGLASDNLLHFNLNAIYVQSSDKERVSRLIGTSLALYMVGISVSPFAAGYFDTTLVSFIFALGLFAVSLLYLVVFVDRPRPKHASKHSTQTGMFAREDEISSPSSPSPQTRANLGMIFRSVFSPLQTLYTCPAAMIPSFSLLLYNTGQAFIFPAIMVHTSLHFGFSAKQNGLLISIAHASSAVYLFFTLWAVPRVIQTLNRRKPRCHASSLPIRYPRTADAVFAVLSLTIQSTFLTVLGLANEVWQVYPIVCLFALGLATPSFIKSHALAYFPVDDAPRAIAALTMMETTGGLLAPVFLGGLQTARPGAGVLFVASGIMGASAVVFGVGALVEKTTRPQLGP
ncbi:MAG: hypothetical protein ASARMPRED_008217 [Alectoria sarmentosa]|nr:MAG: hypothetical protein ASARMPRED_008217 [Alectoria sarmentosa]